MAHRLVVEAVPVVADPRQQAVPFEREHVAVGDVEHLDQAPRGGAQERGQVVGAGHERAELDELVQDDVALADLVEQDGRIERPPGHVREALDQLEVLVEVAWYVVGQLEDADHGVARDQRGAELGLVAPFLERRPAAGREHRVVEARGQGDPARFDGEGGARKVAHIQGRALPRAVEGAVIVADEGTDAFPFDRVDVGDRRVGQAGQTAGDALEDVARRQPSHVLAGLDDELEIVVAGLQSGDGRRLGAVARGGSGALAGLTQERLDVDSSKAAVAAGAAVADDPAGVAPAP